MESRNGMCPLKGDIHANGYVVLINEDWWGGAETKYNPRHNYRVCTSVPVFG